MSGHRSVFLACALGLGCAPLVACAADTLPAQRPADFAASYRHGGGMRPGAVELRCSATGCDRLDSSGGDETRKPVAVSAGDLDALYQTFRAHRFERIRQEKRKGIAYDMPTTTLTLTAAGRSLSLSVGATQTIPDSASGDFRAIVDALTRLVGR